MSVSLLVNALDWPLENWPVALATAALVAVLILFIATFKRSTVSRAELARLDAEVKQLSEDVKGLLVGEQRRFLKEIGVSKRGDDPKPKAVVSNGATAQQEPKRGVA